MKTLNNVGRITVFLRKCYRLMNEQLFDGELPDVQITLVNSARVYGHITLDGGVWQTSDGVGMHEIAISNNYLSNTSSDCSIGSRPPRTIAWVIWFCRYRLSQTS